MTPFATVGAWSPRAPAPVSRPYDECGPAGKPIRQMPPTIDVAAPSRAPQPLSERCSVAASRTDAEVWPAVAEPLYRRLRFPESTDAEGVGAEKRIPSELLWLSLPRPVRCNTLSG